MFEYEFVFRSEGVRTVQDSHVRTGKQGSWVRLGFLILERVGSALTSIQHGGSRVFVRFL